MRRARRVGMGSWIWGRGWRASSNSRWARSSRRPCAPSSSSSERGDHVTHWRTSPVATVELEAPDQAGVGEALQAPLRGGERSRGVEAAVDLAGEHVAHRGDQREDLEVERVGFERAGRLNRRGPSARGGPRRGPPARRSSPRRCRERRPRITAVPSHRAEVFRLVAGHRSISPLPADAPVTRASTLPRRCRATAACQRRARWPLCRGAAPWPARHHRGGARRPRPLPLRVPIHPRGRSH